MAYLNARVEPCTEQHSYVSHNRMDEDVTLQLVDLLKLPEYITWYELHFEYNKSPTVRFCRANSNCIEHKNVVFNNKTNNIIILSINDTIALEIASLLKLPNRFLWYTIRFEACEIPVVTFSQELWFTGTNTETIKEGITKLKEKYHVALQEVKEE